MAFEYRRKKNLARAERIIPEIVIDDLHHTIENDSNFFLEFFF